LFNPLFSSSPNPFSTWRRGVKHHIVKELFKGKAAKSYKLICIAILNKDMSFAES